MRNNTLTLVNHASVLIKGQSQSLLTDPWYDGDAFHRGWRLLYENTAEEVERVLNETTFIWISHEHPDHFSIGFFRKYRPMLIDKNIVVIFQKRPDKRVMQFLSKSGLQHMELDTGEPFTIEQNFTIRVIRDQFYDSALLVDLAGTKICNLNDCPMHSERRITAFQKQYGNCDVLLTQFSYAAWKGGRNNVRWRHAAAEDRMASVVRQARTLHAKTVVPFASFVYFANVLNSYLNDAVNTPQRVIDYCQAAKAPFACVFLRPMESLDLGASDWKQNPASLAFWEKAFGANKTYMEYVDSYSTDELSRLFRLYCERLKKNNSWWLIRCCRLLRVAFRPIVIKLVDTGEVLLVDIGQQSLAPTDREPDIALHSDSLAFIFKFPYGFDTLGVNGTFEELRRGAFSRFAKNFAIENLNSLGYSFTLGLVFDLNLILIFAGRLISACKKLHMAAPAQARDSARAKAA
ncbi:MAG TPA: MBL fold metallo-hydrolase [Nitrospira sp.]|nr:MBL fold metallo-hydrolase [Nitrospira sp.]